MTKGSEVKISVQASLKPSLFYTTVVYKGRQYYTVL